MVKQIHNSVRGRVRYKVKGLYLSMSLKIRLEMLLSEDPEVSQVRASILTGNVLIILDPDCNPRKIAFHVEQVALIYLKENSRIRKPRMVLVFLMPASLPV